MGRGRREMRHQWMWIAYVGRTGAMNSFRLFEPGARTERSSEPGERLQKKQPGNKDALNGGRARSRGATVRNTPLENSTSPGKMVNGARMRCRAMANVTGYSVAARITAGP